MVIRVFGKKLSSFQIIILGFLGTILLGTAILMLPVSVADGQGASFKDALFTSTSAVCVTGLVVRDTAIYWSGFGQAVILVLIQLGGLGIVSFAAFIGIISGRKATLMERGVLQDSFSAPQIGGVVKMTAFIFRIALIAELAGALLMMPVFCGRFGVSGVWMALFHSVSAFCNAGFDIMGSRSGEFSSLTSLQSEPLVVIPVCLLIVIGGIGFLTWKDVAANGFHIRRYRMQSKVVLSTSLILIVIPAVLLFFFEYTGGPVGERLSLSAFQAITPRTAGFNTADLAALTGAGKAMFIVLMLIGGSSGSTAGGMKTTTLAVLFANVIAVFRGRKSPQLFGRRIEDGAVRSALALLAIYLTLPVAAGAVISMVEGLPIGTCVFETVSALGTVGLTLGITPGLGIVSRLVLIVLMFIGRVGGLTLIYAAISGSTAASTRPVEKIVVG